MKTTLIFLSLLIMCALLFFLAPHHHRKPASFQECTLGEIYSGFLRNIPPLTSPRRVLFLILGVAALASTWYPVVFVSLARWSSIPVGHSGGPLLILGGIFAAVGAFANFLAMLISHTSFSFGGASSSHDETFFLWVIPVFQLFFAAASIAAGSSATVANWVRHLLVS